MNEGIISCSAEKIHVFGPGTYSHGYFDKVNRIDSSEPPPYTQSWCDLLTAHSKTCEWVGPGEKWELSYFHKQIIYLKCHVQHSLTGSNPFRLTATIFVSHAHSSSFRSFVAGLKQLVSDLPLHEPAPFLWIDFLCTNLHEKHRIPQEWW